jgi:hypothetical protein
MMVVKPAVGASILIAAASILLQRAWQRGPDWYDEPLPDPLAPPAHSSEGHLARRVLDGEITGHDYRLEMARLAAHEARYRPFTPPAGWAG